MSKVLYVTGGAAVSIGLFLVLSSMRRASHFDDFALLLGAPIVMNGITLALYGVLLLFLGRMLGLMIQIAKKTIWLDAWVDGGKVLVKCPKCAEQLRVASGQTGMLNCPKCGNKFEAKT